MADGSDAHYNHQVNGSVDALWTTDCNKINYFQQPKNQMIDYLFWLFAFDVSGGGGEREN